MELMSFDEAIASSKHLKKKHLVLGNGFSIACCPDIFHYGSIFEEADFSAVPAVKAVFGALGTTDFEIAIKALEDASKVIPAYIGDYAAPKGEMLVHAAALKEILLKTIASRHPAIPATIPDEKFWACRRFLAYFIGHGGGQVFSLNYDLLLYWTLMHDDPDGYEIDLETNDGFGNDETDEDADYVVWQGETGAHNASVHFLHGALHLFDSKSELKKYTWIRSGTPLLDQARAAIDAGAFPLFVAEGASLQKKEKIRHNAYLYQGLKQLTANAAIGTHGFFIFGHSLASNDDHILTRLARGRFPELYVGIYGDPNAIDNKKIIERANGLAALRRAANPLKVSFYSAESAAVWG